MPRTSENPTRPNPDNLVGQEIVLEPVFDDAKAPVEDEAEAERLFESIRSLPPGRSKLEVVADACGRSLSLRHRLGELGLSDGEMTAVALQVADSNPAAFIDLLTYSAFIDLTTHSGPNIEIGRTASLALADSIARNRVEYFGDMAHVLRLKEDDIAHLLSRAAPESRQSLLRSLGVSEAFTPVTRSERPAAGEREPSPEDADLLERTESAEWSLALALAKEYPDRIERERERNAIAEQLMADIEEAAELDTSNRPMIVTLAGRAMPAVYKAKSRELGAGTEHGLRTGITPGSGANREWLAFQIDRALGLDIIPVTVLRDGPDGAGSMQDWKPGRTAAETYFVQKAEADPRMTAQLETIALFDVATVNSDRHAGNWIEKPDGGLEAIDNSLILATGEKQTGNGLRCWPLWVVGGKPISAANQAKLERFENSSGVQAALRQCFEAALGYDAQEAWQDFRKNLDGLRKEPLPAETEWDNLLDFSKRFMYRQGEPNKAQPK